MDLAPLIERYDAPFRARYGARLTDVQRQALFALQHCRSEQYGQMLYGCAGCEQQQTCFRSCGHRLCPHCQHHETARWLDRQLQKRLPVNYYMATFTLPAQLRPLASQHQTLVYNALLACSASTLKDFGLNSTKLGGKMGLIAVLHTHSRPRDYHPHVHVVIPGGCVNMQRRQWKKLKGKYLFNAFALSDVFWARLLDALSRAGLTLPRNLPEDCVVHCKRVGQGKEALQYLSRYLYRGVIREQDIVADDGENVTFRYTDSATGESRYRQLKGEEFLWLLLKHVLPKGFRRVRDYGFLNGNAKRTLILVQYILAVILEPVAPRARPTLMCSHCKTPMHLIGFRRPTWHSG